MSASATAAAGAPPRPARAWLQALALLVATTCAVWLAVLWRWRAGSHALTAADVVVYLVLLPLVVFAFVLALRWAWRGAASRAALPAAAGPAGGATASTPPAPGSDQALRHATLQLLGAHLACACADNPPGLLQAASAGQPLPKLDAELCNAEGLPVMSARIAELPLEALAETLAPLLQQRTPDEAPQPEPPDHVQRALAALQRPLAQALASLQPWRARLIDAEPRPPVHLLIAWPAWWAEADRALATRAVRALLQADEATALAPDQWQIQAQALGSAELWAALDRQWLALQRAQRCEPMLLAAAHSDLSDEAVALLEQQHRLFTPGQHPKGLMPSEAAAVLVLAPADWPAAPDAPADAPRPVHLQRPALMVRDKSIEAPGSVSSQVLIELTASALAAAGLPASAVAAVACDADRHTPRATELFGVLLKSLPQLDPAEHLCMTGAVAGHGEAGALMVVAAAAARVQADPQPCLALALGDSHWRMALLARPAP